MRSGLLLSAHQLRGALLKSRLDAPIRVSVQKRLKPLSTRHFSHTNHLGQNDRSRQQQTQAQLQLRPEQLENIKPESYEEPNKAKPNEPPKTDGLLSEQTVSNKEQRKADWAIMKEMSRYLWPKVSSTFAQDMGRSLIELLGRPRGENKGGHGLESAHRLEGRILLFCIAPV